MALSEHATRKLLIDVALSRCGWSPVIPCDERSQRDLIAFEEHLTATVLQRGQRLNMITSSLVNEERAQRVGGFSPCGQVRQGGRAGGCEAPCFQAHLW